MVDEPVWIPIEALVDAHARTIEQHGGLPGLRDSGALGAAAMRELAHRRRQKFLVFGQQGAAGL